MQGYSSIMVGLDMGAGASGRVKLAADLADRFNATLIGFACRQPMQEVLGDAYTSCSCHHRARSAVSNRHAQYLLCGLCVRV